VCHQMRLGHAQRVRDPRTRRNARPKIGVVFGRVCRRLMSTAQSAAIAHSRKPA